MIDKAMVVSTGRDLISGSVVDTNSAAIADRLSALGVEVTGMLTVPDDRAQLLWALEQARDKANLVIGTGGLGPTTEDLTAEVVAEFIGCRLKQDDQVADALERDYVAREMPWTANLLKQVRFPEGAIIIPNPVGTAPGFRVALGPEQYLIWLAGAPREMTAMLDESVVPWIRRQSGNSNAILTSTFKIYGLTESQLDEILSTVELGSSATLSFRAHYPDLSLRLTVRNHENRDEIFSRLNALIGERLGTFAYSSANETLEEVIGRLISGKHQTLALAESCTGGFISQRITRVAGSSAYYYGGVVTYSNDAKIHFLGVNPTTLNHHGAVSRETALEMSQGIRNRTGANVGLSITGIAGPTGATPGKPVGTVWISIAKANLHEARHCRFHGDRERIIHGASQAALNWLRMTLLEPDP